MSWRSENPHPGLACQWHFKAVVLEEADVRRIGHFLTTTYQSRGAMATAIRGKWHSQRGLENKILESGLVFSRVRDRLRI